MQADLFLTSMPLKTVDLKDKTAIVIDVPRSTASICAAFTAGARGTIPTAGRLEAGEMRSRLGEDAVALVGKRDSVRIENLDFGSPPAEFVRESVGNVHTATETDSMPVLPALRDGRLILQEA